ncbi:MAG: DUF5103 domain-containing protein [Bacteroidetes bacterium]|nr:DUF5103 domain-containing protein [Bacteroidota bacterium]
MKSFLAFVGSLSFFLLQAQRLPDRIYSPTINGVKLFQQNNQYSQPILRLNSGEQLELHFDDLVATPKNYFYTYELCNADWTPANVTVFDYLKGFTQMRISQYRIASIAAMKYVHYQVMLPERNATPIMSGNYILKVFRDGDTSKLAFTKRLMVVDKQVSIGAQVQVPYDNQLARTHQKLQFSVETRELNLLSPQQVKVAVVQNNRWDDAIVNKQPVFIKGNLLEYNGEMDFLFPAGKEYRWADLMSFRFESDRIARIERTQEPNTVYIKPDLVRSSFAYINFADRNGYTEINASESINPWWQGDYAWVHFSFVPPAKQAFPGKSVHMIGEVTGNQISDSSLMHFSTLEGAYTKDLLLKQGYYSYTYALKDNREPGLPADVSILEGNYWETENEYTIFVYYRSLSGRHDELVGIATINSRLGR